jgi:hypothetical protein
VGGGTHQGAAGSGAVAARGIVGQTATGGNAKGGGGGGKYVTHPELLCHGWKMREQTHARAHQSKKSSFLYVVATGATLTVPSVATFASTS